MGFNRQSVQRNQSFMEMIKSAKGSSQEDELDDDEEFVLKKEISTNINHKGMCCGYIICWSYCISSCCICIITFWKS